MISAPPLVEEAYARAERAGFELSCEPEVGRLLAVLAAAVPSGGRILELGTGVGAGTAWLAHGIQGRDDVELVTVDVDAANSALAREGEWPAAVRFVVQDALAALRELGAADLIFADAPAGKVDGLDETLAALRPGGMLVVDDMVPPVDMGAVFAGRIHEVRRRLLADRGLRAVELSTGSGVIIAARTVA